MPEGENKNVMRWKNLRNACRRSQAQDAAQRLAVPAMAVADAQKAVPSFYSAAAGSQAKRADRHYGQKLKRQAEKPSMRNSGNENHPFSPSTKQQRAHWTQRSEQIAVETLT